MTVLLTGFAPFGGSASNPSWQAVSLVAARREDVVAVELPCEFDASLPALRAAIEQYRPAVVVCVGQAGGRTDVTPERVAINLVDARIPDNAGAQPVDVPVVANGPAAYFTSLPVKAAVAAIHAAGLPGSVSHTAGTYVCNQVFYGLMHLLATDFPELRGGFVHVPSSPEQVPDAGPSLPVEKSAAALEAVVETVLSVREDLDVSAGTLN
ncbi:pyroglutamyl-peptidase I [Amycolatopsis sp. PS_44_ISF1]|uniref:pyroglutamyl-peptidase I n=1 Tax=Amycolatopsis sp. PS_44_ISF1 TaxID=2974917 RepID=UPI0028DE9406|nr:pyroglutamyl-peptidase I [Amycolatopsis sp. PS_44_ISF1]MDT8910976.1 pyroglutamyl-peptidase I [Amycolatopsis sp. PS_44_ISF1]